MNWMKEVVNRYGDEYIIRQLAEESAELTQAALKLVRAINNETPVRQTEAQMHLLEEIADVEVMLDFLKCGILTSEANDRIARIFFRKQERMRERMLDNTD